MAMNIAAAKTIMFKRMDNSPPKKNCMSNTLAITKLRQAHAPLTIARPVPRLRLTERPIISPITYPTPAAIKIRRKKKGNIEFSAHHANPQTTAMPMPAPTALR